MADTGASKPSLKQRISDELMELAVSAAYLCVCFTAITYFKFAVLQANDIPFAPFGFAATKALVCAKFMSLGHMAHLGDRYKNQALIWPVLRKSFAFLLLLFVLDAAEEVLIGFMHGRALMASLAEVSGGTRDQLIARSILGLLILLPFFALRELGNIVGGRTLARLFFEPRRGIDHAAGDAHD
jgi:hypothetical protein